MLRLDLEDPDIGYDARKVDHSNMAGCAESQCPETQRRTKETDLRWKTNFETDYILHARIFPGGSVVKNLSANARDTGSIPGLGRSPGRKWQPSPVFFLSWEIPWTEESGGLPSMGSQKVRYDLVTEKYQHILCTNQKTKRH